MDIDQLFEDLEFLVVDDDPIFRSRLVRALQDRGYSRSIGAASVHDAIRVFQRIPVQRTILDLRMGEEDGMKLLEFLLATEAETDVVILSGYGSIATAIQAMKNGAINFLTKPISVDQILLAFKQRDRADPLLSVPQLPEVEWEHIQRVVSDCEGNVSRAAKALGMHRRSLQRKLQKPPRRTM